MGEASVYFQLELNTLGVLSVPTGKNLKDWGQARAGGGGGVGGGGYLKN
jgi:hypothetical protein